MTVADDLDRLVSSTNRFAIRPPDVPPARTLDCACLPATGAASSPRPGSRMPSPLSQTMTSPLRRNRTDCGPFERLSRAPARGASEDDAIPLASTATMASCLRCPKRRSTKRSHRLDARSAANPKDQLFDMFVDIRLNRAWNAFGVSASIFEMGAVRAPESRRLFDVYPVVVWDASSGPISSRSIKRADPPLPPSLSSLCRAIDGLRPFITCVFLRVKSPSALPKQSSSSK